jgi:hypothetical protein
MKSATSFVHTCLVAVSALGLMVGGAHAAQAPDAGVMKNADVIELGKMKLGDDVTLEKIKASRCEFDVSMDGLRALKAAGVSPVVIAEMVRASSKAGVEKKQAEALEAGKNNPLAPHPGGIYYWDGEEGTEGQLVMLEPTVYSQSKSGGFFKSAMTMGIAKVKSKAVLNGATANLLLNRRKPTFYFYFETASAGLGGAGAGYFTAATSANEFLLVQTEAKTNSRELIVGQMNAFGAQGGVMDKSVVQFDFEKLANGAYKVVPKTDLPPGEYCFFYAGAAPMATYGFSGPGGGGKVFDFSLR